MAITLDGRSWQDFTRTRDESVHRLGVILSRMGSEHGVSSFSLWALPPGMTSIRDVDGRTWPIEYLQCAGSAQEMTVELSELVLGERIHAVVGMVRDDPGRVPVIDDRVDIRWAENTYSTLVLPHEVFDAGQALELFVRYLDDQTVPNDTYTRRPLDGHAKSSHPS